ncbi:transposase domain-containing protein, partial [Rhizobium sp. Nf11,1]
WLADVLARIADMPIAQLEQLLPWNWSSSKVAADKAA